MKKNIMLITTALLVGCGDNSVTSTEDINNSITSTTNVNDSESNIPYLKANHANYSEHGSTQTPAPTKDANAKSINWTITATTEEGAIKLEEHLAFMEKQLATDQNPRPWDKLFLMEAYMKFNKSYTTSVERSATNIIVSKTATTACAYEVISAHSDAVSGDFFAQGNLGVDNSSKAESILASTLCDSERASIESYISERLKIRG